MSLDGKINYNYAGYQLKFDPSKTSSTIMDFNTPKPKIQQAKYTNTQIGNIWGQPTSRIYTSSQNAAPVFSQYTTPTLSQNAAPIFNQQPKVYTPVQNTAPLFSQYTTPTLSQNAAPIFNQPTNTLNVQPPLTQSTNLPSNIPAKPQNAYSGSLPPVKNGDMYGKFLAENPIPQATPIQLIDENKKVADKPITGDTDAGKQAKPKRVKTAEQRAAQLRKIRSNPRARSLYKRLKLKNNPELASRYENYCKSVKNSNKLKGLKKAGKWGALAALAIGTVAVAVQACKGGQKDDAVKPETTQPVADTQTPAEPAKPAEETPATPAPAPTEPETPVEQTNPVAPVEIGVGEFNDGKYKVKKGDTFWNIAEKNLIEEYKKAQTAKNEAIDENYKPTDAEILKETERLVAKNKYEFDEKHWNTTKPIYEGDILNIAA